MADFILTRLSAHIPGRLRRVRAADFVHILKFLAALPAAMVYRKFRPHLWLLCECGAEARDNGYCLFHYLRQFQPQVDAVYAITREGRDFPKVGNLGETVEYGSFKHWLYYLAADVNISSQKGGKPNAAVCYFLEVSGILKNTRVFLQHGVIKDDLPFLHYKYTRMRLFACAAQPEYEFVRDTFGYPDGYVRYLGLCRFDDLHRAQADQDLILIAPTWRQYLREGKHSFGDSDYFHAWSGLLKNAKFGSLLAKYHKKVIFCPHRDMQSFAGMFTSPFPEVTVLKWENADVSELIHRAGVLVTDYSSIFMDFAYMKRPVLYYQFDYEDYRSGHWPPGYFDYRRDGFGPVCENPDELLQALKLVFAGGGRMASEYLERQKRFFRICDDKNCERTYEAIKEVCDEKQKYQRRPH